MNELLRRLLFLPPQASTLAADVDGLHYFVIITTMLGATAVGVAGVWFSLKYRRRRHQAIAHPPQGPTGSGAQIEIGIIVALFVVFVAWWVIGFRQYLALRIAPEDAIPVYVTAKQWMWKFAYPDGGHSVATLYVPAGRPVKLILTSRDVVHSFFVPAFRVKQDAVPGRYTTAWFEVKRPGTYPIFCTEYCGNSHSTMRGEVVALSAEDWARWVAAAYPEVRRPNAPAKIEPGTVDLFDPREETSLAREGARLAGEHGCLRCHSVDGTRYIGPTWAGLWGARVPLMDGTEIVADVAYLTESIAEPARRWHKGYQLVMPSYAGRIPPGDVSAILEYIRSLSRAPAPVSPDPAGPIDFRPTPAAPTSPTEETRP
jgi:cytochrome c oxidase subunit 2